MLYILRVLDSCHTVLFNSNLIFPLIPILGIKAKSTKMTVVPKFLLVKFPKGMPVPLTYSSRQYCAEMCCAGTHMHPPELKV